MKLCSMTIALSAFGLVGAEDSDVVAQSINNIQYGQGILDLGGSFAEGKSLDTLDLSPGDFLRFNKAIERVRDFASVIGIGGLEGRVLDDQHGRRDEDSVHSFEYVEEVRWGREGWSEEWSGKALQCRL